eukprot:g39086.t1
MALCTSNAIFSCKISITQVRRFHKKLIARGPRVQLTRDCFPSAIGMWIFLLLALGCAGLVGMRSGPIQGGTPLMMKHAGNLTDPTWLQCAFFGNDPTLWRARDVLKTNSTHATCQTMPAPDRGSSPAVTYPVHLIVNGSEVVVSDNFTFYDLCPFINTSACLRTRSIWAVSWQIANAHSPSPLLQVHGHWLGLLPDLSARLLAENGSVVGQVAFPVLPADGPAEEWSTRSVGVSPAVAAALYNLQLSSNGATVDLYPVRGEEMYLHLTRTNGLVAGVIAALVILVLLSLLLSYADFKRSRRLQFQERVAWGEQHGMEMVHPAINLDEVEGQEGVETKELRTISGPGGHRARGGRVMPCSGPVDAAQQQQQHRAEGQDWQNNFPDTSAPADAMNFHGAVVHVQQKLEDDADEAVETDPFSMDPHAQGYPPPPPPPPPPVAPAPPVAWKRDALLPEQPPAARKRARSASKTKSVSRQHSQSKDLHRAEAQDNVGEVDYKRAARGAVELQMVEQPEPAVAEHEAERKQEEQEVPEQEQEQEQEKDFKHGHGAADVVPLAPLTPAKKTQANGAAASSPHIAPPSGGKQLKVGEHSPVKGECSRQHNQADFPPDPLDTPGQARERMHSARAFLGGEAVRRAMTEGGQGADVAYGRAPAQSLAQQPGSAGHYMSQRTLDMALDTSWHAVQRMREQNGEVQVPGEEAPVAPEEGQEQYGETALGEYKENDPAALGALPSPSVLMQVSPSQSAGLFPSPSMYNAPGQFRSKYTVKGPCAQLAYAMLHVLAMVLPFLCLAFLRLEPSHERYLLITVFGLGAAFVLLQFLNVCCRRPFTKSHVLAKTHFRIQAFTFAILALALKLHALSRQQAGGPVISPMSAYYPQSIKGATDSLTSFALAPPEQVTSARAAVSVLIMPDAQDGPADLSRSAEQLMQSVLIALAKHGVGREEVRFVLASYLPFSSLEMQLRAAKLLETNSPSFPASFPDPLVAATVLLWLHFPCLYPELALKRLEAAVGSHRSLQVLTGGLDSATSSQARSTVLHTLRYSLAGRLDSDGTATSAENRARTDLTGQAVVTALVPELILDSANNINTALSTTAQRLLSLEAQLTGDMQGMSARWLVRQDAASGVLLEVCGEGSALLFLVDHFHYRTTTATNPTRSPPGGKASTICGGKWQGRCVLQLLYPGNAQVEPFRKQLGLPRESYLNLSTPFLAAGPARNFWLVSNLTALDDGEVEVLSDELRALALWNAEALSLKKRGKCQTVPPPAGSGQEISLFTQHAHFFSDNPFGSADSPYFRQWAQFALDSFTGTYAFDESSLQGGGGGAGRGRHLQQAEEERSGRPEGLVATGQLDGPVDQVAQLLQSISREETRALFGPDRLHQAWLDDGNPRVVLDLELDAEPTVTVLEDAPSVLHQGNELWWRISLNVTLPVAARLVALQAYKLPPEASLPFAYTQLSLPEQSVWAYQANYSWQVHVQVRLGDYLPADSASFVRRIRAHCPVAATQGVRSSAARFGPSTTQLPIADLYFFLLTSQLAHALLDSSAILSASPQLIAAASRALGQEIGTVDAPLIGNSLLQDLQQMVNTASQRRVETVTIPWESADDLWRSLADIAMCGRALGLQARLATTANIRLLQWFSTYLQGLPLPPAPSVSSSSPSFTTSAYFSHLSVQPSANNLTEYSWKLKISLNYSSLTSEEEVPASWLSVMSSTPEETVPYRAEHDQLVLTTTAALPSLGLLDWWLSSSLACSFTRPQIGTACGETAGVRWGLLQPPLVRYEENSGTIHYIAQVKSSSMSKPNVPNVTYLVGAHVSFDRIAPSQGLLRPRFALPVYSVSSWTDHPVGPGGSDVQWEVSGLNNLQDAESGGLSFSGLSMSSVTAIASWLERAVQDTLVKLSSGCGTGLAMSPHSLWLLEGAQFVSTSILPGQLVVSLNNVSAQQMNQTNNAASVLSLLTSPKCRWASDGICLASGGEVAVAVQGGPRARWQSGGPAGLSLSIYCCQLHTLLAASLRADPGRSLSCRNERNANLPRLAPAGLGQCYDMKISHTATSSLPQGTRDPAPWARQCSENTVLTRITAAGAQCCELHNALLSYDNCQEVRLARSFAPGVFTPLSTPSPSGNANRDPGQGPATSTPSGSGLPLDRQCPFGSVAVGLATSDTYGLYAVKCCPILPLDIDASCPGMPNPDGSGLLLCSGHGVCLSNRLCSCSAGWSGPSCDKRQCATSGQNNQAVCGGSKGRCLATGLCECESGWKGTTCEVADCTLSCGPHGHCAGGTVEYCVCNPGYEGRFCNVPTRCPDPTHTCFHYQIGDGICDLDCFLSSCGDGADCDQHCPCMPEGLEGTSSRALDLPCHPSCRVPACPDNCRHACDPQLCPSPPAHHNTSQASQLSSTAEPKQCATQCASAECLYDFGACPMREPKALLVGDVQSQGTEPLQGAGLDVKEAWQLLEAGRTAQPALLTGCASPPVSYPYRWDRLHNLTLQHTLRLNDVKDVQDVKDVELPVPELTLTVHIYRRLQQSEVLPPKQPQLAAVLVVSQPDFAWTTLDPSAAPCREFAKPTQSGGCGEVWGVLQELVFPLVANLSLALGKASPSDPQPSILLTGSGLGAAAAQYVALALSTLPKPSPTVQLVGFGWREGGAVPAWCDSVCVDAYRNSVPESTLLQLSHCQAVNSEQDPSTASQEETALSNLLALTYLPTQLVRVLQPPSQPVLTAGQDGLIFPCSVAWDQAIALTFEQSVCPDAMFTSFCVTTCPVGTWQSGCAEVSCFPCTTAPEGAIYTTASPGIGVDNCSWACPPDTFQAESSSYSLAAISCQPCEQLSCPAGSFRLGCESCQPCSEGKPEVASWTGPCTWSCPIGSYADPTGRDCLPCRPTCAVGRYLADCGGSSPGLCRACSNKPDFSTYIGPGGLADDCSWECLRLYYRQGSSSLDAEAASSDVCVACQHCQVGQWREGCGGAAGGVCRGCTGLPDHAVFTSHGGFSDNCDWTCEAPFYRVNQQTLSCTACNPELCEVGEWLSGCQGANPGVCTPCVNKPGASHFVSHGGLTGDCEFECDQEFYWSEGKGACLHCATDCASGQFRTGCGGDSQGSCVECSNLPQDAFWTNDGGLEDSCQWACLRGLYRDPLRPMCLPCVSCDRGQYRTGCGATDAGQCQACTNAPPNSVHNVADNCGWTCMAAFYQVNNTCQACPTDCPVGQYRFDCGQEYRGSCVACTGRPVASIFTTGGGLTDSCAWTCLAQHYLVGVGDNQECLPCQRCEVGQYRVGCGQNTGSGSCRACTLRVQHARFTTDGGFEDNCEWACVDDFYLSFSSSQGGQECIACNRSACAVGEYLADCGGASAGRCVSCTNKPAAARYTSNGGLSNACAFACNERFFLDAGQGTCLQCETDCPVGQYRVGCGGAGAGRCTPCSGLPVGAYWTNDGGLSDSCLWSCSAGSWKEDQNCVTCASCPVGSWRDNCGGENPGLCKPCQNAAQNSYYTTGGSTVPNSCQWSCNIGSYADPAGLDCLPCRPTCAVGRYLADCGGSSPGLCRACSNKPDFSTYVGPGGLADDCSWECLPLYYRQGSSSLDAEAASSDVCVACQHCQMGQWREGCGGAAGGVCRGCTGLPDHAVFTSHGGFSDNCDWTCEAPFYRVNQQTLSCTACNPELCEVGEWLSGCQGANPGVCTPCVNKPGASHFVSHGGLTGDCEFECDQEFYWSEGKGACLHCATDCASGQFRTGCGGDSQGSCVECSNLPQDAFWTNDGGLEDSCQWACLRGLYRHPFRPMCLPCVSCDRGQYRTGCGATDAGQCQACTNAPPNSAYNVADNCGWTCMAAFYQVNNTCQACPTDCPVGQYRFDCGQEYRGSCVACTGRPVASIFTTGGGLTDSCAWTCLAQHYLVGVGDNQECLPCQRCEVGQYRVGCGQNTGSGSCRACTLRVQHARFTTDGGFEDNCEWACVDDFYLSFSSSQGGQECIACNRSACAVGEYLADCGGASAGRCVSCTNKPAAARYTSNGGLSNACAFACNERFFLDAGQGTCLQCETDCPVGQYRVGCGGAGAGRCTPCSGLPVGAYWTNDGGLSDSCLWSCSAGSWKEDQNCVTCASCPVGSWRDNCGGENPGLCKPCQNAAQNSYYTTGGSTVPNSCQWACDVNFYYQSGRCASCARSCRAGMFLTGCNHGSMGECVPCLNLPRNARYLPDTTGQSVDNGNCPFVCDAGFYGPRCESCERGTFCRGAGQCFVRNEGPVFCECETGFSGNSCQTCSVAALCSNHAGSCSKNANGATVCVTDGQVKCERGYYGEQCQFCDADILCNGRGTCRNSDGRCTCRQEFTGTDCFQCAEGYFPPNGNNKCSKFCNPAQNCRGRAECNGQGNCGRCEQGWTGNDCSIAQTFAFSNTIMCPLYAPVPVEFWWETRTCVGDCSQCTTLASWTAATAPPPTCLYRTNKYYKFLKGNDCWDGDSVCNGDTRKGVKCKATPNVVQGATCPNNRTPLAKFFAATRCDGECSSCTTEEGFATEAPICYFWTRKYYKVLEGTKCWDGPNACIANRILYVACP